MMNVLGTFPAFGEIFFFAMCIRIFPPSLTAQLFCGQVMISLLLQRKLWEQSKLLIQGRCGKNSTQNFNNY